MSVSVTPANAGERPVLENLFQLYIHDFTEFWAGSDRGELQADGRFAPDPHLDAYWTEAGREPFLIRAGGHLAGFALLNRHSHSGLPLDHNVAEFFVVRKHRRAGVASEAMRQLIAPRSGAWEAAVVRANTGALSFWRRVARAAAGDAVEELELADARWNGWVLRFRAG